MFEVLSVLDVTFLNNFQVVLKCFKGDNKVLVAISQRYILIDEGFGFFLEGFKGGRLTIMSRDRGLGGNSLHRRSGVFFHPGVHRGVGGFRATGLEWGSKRVSSASPSSPLSIRHQRVGTMDSVDRGDKITNNRG